MNRFYFNDTVLLVLLTLSLSACAKPLENLTEPDSGNNNGTSTDTDTDIDTDSDGDADADSDGDADADSDSDADADSDSDADADSDSDADTDSDSEKDSGSDIGGDPHTDVDKDTNSDSDIGEDTYTDSDRVDTTPDSDIDDHTHTDSDSDADSDSHEPVDSDSEPEDFPEVADPVFESPWFPCPGGDYPEHTVVVKTHDDVVHTSSSTNIDAQVALPEGSFKAVALRVEHECPTGGICDLYDRRAQVQLIRRTDEGEQPLELMRYVTTYRFNPGQTNYMCSWTDITPYASLLTGQQTIRSSLDTVVGPGHELGDGWQVSVELVFYPGPAPGVSQILELYGKSIRIGAAPGSIDEETPPTSVMIPQDAATVLAQLTVSGHGWGPENTDNCAEFCRLDQSIRVDDGTPHIINPFRTDCAQNPLAPFQQRNPTGSRNGWCPGAVVLPYIVDITSEVTLGMEAAIDFGVQRSNGREYIDADPTGFNPEEFVSLQLLVYSDSTP